jgi:hypothetical protein
VALVVAALNAGCFRVLCVDGRGVRGLGHEQFEKGPEGWSPPLSAGMDV